MQLQQRWYYQVLGQTLLKQFEASEQKGGLELWPKRSQDYSKQRWCQVSHVGGTARLGVGAGQQGQQRDGARYEERARLWVMTKAMNYERVWTVAWDRPVLKNSASGPKKL